MYLQIKFYFIEIFSWKKIFIIFICIYFENADVYLSFAIYITVTVELIVALIVKIFCIEQKKKVHKQNITKDKWG